MKVQNTQHFENFSLIQNNPSGASRHLPLHKGGFDFCETTKNRFIDTLKELPCAVPFCYKSAQYCSGGYYLPAKSVQDFDVQIIDVLSYFFTIYFYLLL